MELPTIDDKIEIQVEFIDDQAVKHLISDDTSEYWTAMNKLKNNPLFKIKLRLFS